MLSKYPPLIQIDSIPHVNILNAVITTDFIIVSKTFAALIKECPEGVLESSFASIEGCRDIELRYTTNGVTVEWCDNWTAINRLNSHTFLVILTDGIPAAILSERLKRFETTYFETAKPSATKGGRWFDQLSRRLAGESDLEFEYRMLQTLAALFKVFKRRADREAAGLTTGTQKQKPAMNHLHPFDRPAFYIDSPTCSLSTNQIKQGVASGTITPETMVYCLEGQPLPFTAGLVVACNSTGTFHPVTFPSEPLPHLRHNPTVRFGKSVQRTH